MCYSVVITECAPFLFSTALTNLTNWRRCAALDAMLSRTTTLHLYLQSFHKTNNHNVSIKSMQCINDCELKLEEMVCGWLHETAPVACYIIAWFSAHPHQSLISLIYQGASVSEWASTTEVVFCTMPSGAVELQLNLTKCNERSRQHSQSSNLKSFRGGLSFRLGCNG